MQIQQKLTRKHLVDLTGFKEGEVRNPCSVSALNLFQLVEVAVPGDAADENAENLWILASGEDVFPELLLRHSDLLKQANEDIAAGLTVQAKAEKGC